MSLQVKRLVGWGDLWRARRAGSCVHSLIVEDDEPLAEVMRRTLAASGISADTCRTRQAALVFLDKGHYNLVIMAMSLSDRDGLDLLAQIRAQNRLLPVIVVTHRHTVADRVKALDLGANDYLTKPFLLKELAARGRAVSAATATTGR